MRDEERYSSSRPLKEFHGNEDDYPDWETDFETWSVRHGYDRHLEMEDPRERDRVWASYTVSRNDDPLGPIGARIYRESPEDIWLDARRKRRESQRSEREQKRRRRDADDEKEKGEANLAQQLGALTEALQKQAEDMKIVKSALQL